MLKSILIIYILIIKTSTYLTQCLYGQCICNTINSDFIVHCSDKLQLNKTSMNMKLDLNDLNLKIKINETKNFSLLIDLSKNSVELHSIDLSNNQKSFESYFKTLNTFKTLNVLNLSFNRIGMLKASQFDRLNELKVLDLSFNEIFYFESNSFNGLFRFRNTIFSKLLLLKSKCSILLIFPALKCVNFFRDTLYFFKLFN